MTDNKPTPDLPRLGALWRFLLFPFQLLSNFFSWLLRVNVSPHSPFGVLRQAATAKPHVFYSFVFANIVFGLAGVWAQMLTPAWVPTTTVFDEFIKSLRAGNLSTFAIAFLVSSSVFVLLEYIDGRFSTVRMQKGLAFFVVIALLVALSMVTGMQAVSQMSFSASAKPFTWELADSIQIILVLVSSCFCFYLFGLSQIDLGQDAMRAEKEGGKQDLLRGMSSLDSSDLKI